MRQFEIHPSKTLEIDSYVICLSNLNSEVIENKINSSKLELRKTFAKEIENPNIIASDIRIIGLNEF